MTESSRTTDRDASAPTRRAREAIVERHLEGLPPSARKLFALVRSMQRATIESRRSRARRLPTWMTVARIASLLGLDESTVKRARALLVERGLLVTIASTLDNGSRRNAATIMLARDVFEVDWGSDLKRVHGYVVTARRAWRRGIVNGHVGCAPFPRAVERVGWSSSSSSVFDPSEFERTLLERARWVNDTHSVVVDVRGASAHQAKNANDSDKSTGNAGARAEGANTAELAQLRGREALGSGWTETDSEYAAWGERVVYKPPDKQIFDPELYRRASRTGAARRWERRLLARMRLASSVEEATRRTA